MSLKIRVITPDKIVWNTPAEEVVLPSTTGQLGILNDHAPLITALEIGVLRLKLENNWKPLILLGGFAEVENNEVTILVNGVEILNYKSKNIVYHGNLNDISILDGGDDYDVINPPVLSITDNVGSGATGASVFP